MSSHLRRLSCQLVPRADIDPFAGFAVPARIGLLFFCFLSTCMGAYQFADSAPCPKVGRVSSPPSLVFSLVCRHDIAGAHHAQAYQQGIQSDGSGKDLEGEGRDRDGHALGSSRGNDVKAPQQPTRGTTAGQSARTRSVAQGWPNDHACLKRKWY